MGSLSFEFLAGLKLLDRLLCVRTTVAEGQLGGRIAELNLGIGRKGNKRDGSPIHQRHPLRHRRRVIKRQLLDSWIEQLLLTLRDLGEA